MQTEKKQQVWWKPLISTWLNLLSLLQQMKGRRLVYQTSRFGLRLQLRVRKVSLTTGVAFVLRLSPPWRYSSVEETRKGLILFLTDVVPNSRSPLPGCRGRSASSSGSADMIERSITLGYHHFQCRSSASREQRWARNQLEGVGGPAGQQVAGEARVPAPPPLGKQPYSYYRQVILG